MTETNLKGSKWKVFKKLFLCVILPLFICFLIYGWFFIYNLPGTVSSYIKQELDKYDFGPYSIEAIAVRHNKAVLGPISFGEGQDLLKVAKVQLNYSFAGIQNGEIKSITVSGADLHLNRQGDWQLSGLKGILRGIANFQKMNPSEEKSAIPLINVETSLLTLHYLGRQYSFPLSITVSEKDGSVMFDVRTNLSRDHIQIFTFVLDQETLALALKLDSFNLEIAQAGHFLQKFGMKDSKGSISASDIRLNISQDKFDIDARVQIDNFKTVYIDEGKPVTLTFDKLEPVAFSRNLKDNKDIFADTIKFHNLGYSYGTYLFNADEIKSKVYFDISTNTYKTDSLLNKVEARIDGSKINSLSEIELRLNWENGILHDYHTKGKLDLLYSGGLFEGITNIAVTGTDKSLKVAGDFKDLKIPDGSIKSGTFTYRDQKDLLNLDVNAEGFSILRGNLKGSSSFVYKKENGLVDISGSLKDLSIFEYFTGNGQVSIKESENEVKTTLKNFSFKSKENAFDLALDAVLTMPITFDDFINKPMTSTFSASSSVSHLKIGDYKFKPISLKANGTPQVLNFSADKFESADLSFVKITNLAGSLDFNRRKAAAGFKTHVDFGKNLPALKGKLEPANMTLNISANKGLINLQINDNLPESSFSFQSKKHMFKFSVKHQSSIQALIPLNDILKSKLTSLQLLTQVNFKDVKSGPIQIDETSTVLKLASQKAVGIENYLDLSLKGSLNNSVNSMSFGLKKATAKEVKNLGIPQWKEGLQIDQLTSEFPFQWSIRKGFNDNLKRIKLASLSHFRWVDGGDFLGYFPKKVSIEKLDLSGIIKGLKLEMNEDIQLNEKLSVNLKLNSGWQIPEDVLSGSKSPLPFLTQLALVPEHSFESSGTLKMGDVEITELASFVKEPISEDNIVRGKVSAEVNFLQNREGLKVPAVVEIKNTRAYIVGENDYYLKIKGLRGKLKFESLLDLKSEDSQYLRIDYLEGPGLKLNNTLVKYKIYSPEKVRIMRLNTTWCGGKIEGADILFNPAYQSLNCTVYASRVEMEEVMKLMKGVDCKANGSLYGRLTLEVRNGKIMDQNGFLFSEPGTKMSLQMQGDNVIYNSITDSRTRKLLSNLDVQYFKILFRGGSDIDKHKTIFNLKGTSPVGDPPNPLDLSINFNGPVIYYLQLPLHEQGIKEFIENKTKGKK